MKRFKEMAILSGTIKIIISKEEWESLTPERQEYLKMLLKEKHNQDIKFYGNDERDVNDEEE